MWRALLVRVVIPVKVNTNITKTVMKKLIPSKWRLAAAGFILSLACTSTFAANIYKATATPTLDDPAAWEGGVVPTNTDIAVWDSRITAGLTESWWSSLSWQGIQCIGHSHPTLPNYRIVLQSYDNSDPATTLTIGSSGIDLSVTYTNLCDLQIIGPIVIGADQTWTITNGRTLTVYDTSTGTNHLTVVGPGSFSTYNNAPFGTGPLTLGGNILLSHFNYNPGTGYNGPINIPNAVTLNGDIAIYGNANPLNTAGGSFVFNGGLATGSSDRTVTLFAMNATSGSEKSCAASIVSALTGTGTLVLSNGDSATYPLLSFELSSGASVSTGVRVQSGVSIYGKANNLFGSSAKLQIEAGGRFEMAQPNPYTSGGYGGVTYSQTIGALNGAGVITSHAYTGWGGQNNNGILTVDSSVTGVDSVFSGNITDTAEGVIGLTKSGAKTLTLSGNSAYNGPTTVNGGTLLVNGTVTNGVGPYHQNTLTVASGATLGGSGSIQCSSAVVGGKIAPGSGGIGQLNIIAGTAATWNGAATASSSADWNFDLAAGNTSDKLNITGDFNGGAGPVFRFDFGGSTHTGVFTLVSWSGTTTFSGSEFSATNIGGGNSATFAVVGKSLQATVGPSLPSTPTNIAYTVSGGTMTVSWPPSYVGWILQAQTNGLNPSLWFDISGTDSLSSTNLPIDPANKSVLYRLRHP